MFALLIYKLSKNNKPAIFTKSLLIPAKVFDLQCIPIQMQVAQTSKKTTFYIPKF